MSSVPALVVANQFIQLGLADGRPVDPMKLQKLVYIAEGWSLVKRHKPLIRESVEAWPYGPVVPQLYTAFKSYRAANIDRPCPLPPRTPTLDADEDELLRQVWEQYRGLTAIELSMMTHEQGSAWDLARKAAGPDIASPTIPPAFIRDEFQRRLRNTP